MLSHLGSHQPILILLVTVLVGFASRTFSRPVGGYGDPYAGVPSYPWRPEADAGHPWQDDPFNGLTWAASRKSADSSAGSSAAPHNEFTVSHHTPPLYQAYEHYANAPIPQDRRNRLISLPTTQDPYLHHDNPVSQFYHPQGFAQHFQPYTNAVGSEMGTTAASAGQPNPPVPIWSEAPPIVATTSTNSGPHHNWGAYEAPAVLDTSAPAQARIGQSSAPRENVWPGPTGVLDRSEIVMRSGRKLGEWENIMRTLLGNPNLEFVTADELYPTISRIIVATNPSLGIRDLHPDAASPRTIPWSKKAHFTKDLFAGQSEREKALIGNLDPGPSKDRVYIYLNSRSNMEHLNRHYFMGKLHFLPIQTANLGWNRINSMVMHDKSAVMLPPSRPGGMPLTMVRHLGHMAKTHHLLKLTGELGNQQHLVSLWSPMLKEKGRTTFVFYGIGQLDKKDAEQVSSHLQELKDRWGEKILEASWDLEEYFPIGSTMH